MIKIETVSRQLLFTLIFGLLGAFLLTTPQPASEAKLSRPNSLGALMIRRDERALLWALNQVEASGRREVPARFEAGFYRRYLRNNDQFASAEKRYGSRAIASSYGPWQVMYPTAVWFGYEGAPQELGRARVSLPYALQYIRYLDEKFNHNTAKVISAYNAGPGGIGTNPSYTRRVLALLEKAPSSWRVYGSAT